MTSLGATALNLMILESFICTDVKSSLAQNTILEIVSSHDQMGFQEAKFLALLLFAAHRPYSIADCLDNWMSSNFFVLSK